MSDRRRKTVNATVALLEALPSEWLADVVVRLELAGLMSRDDLSPAPSRRCTICQLPYPKCRAQWADDHEWSEPRPKGADV